MSLLTYEHPDITGETEKPMAIANKHYPYSQLADPRRLEELVYSLYKSEIEGSGFRGFDAISLMSGIKDRGRDCVLFKNQRSHGVIQCKKYDRSITTNEFGTEIVKFVLYSLLDPSLIYDANDFTYFITAPNGFVGDCIDFIDDFTSRIRSELMLSNWIRANASNYTLNSFQLKNPLEEVLDVLTRIRVEKIIADDLDKLLSKEQNKPLLPLFFEVRAYVNASSVEDLKNELTRHFNGDMNPAELTHQLALGSLPLRGQQNEFEGISDSHINRTETDELFSWLMTPLKKNDQKQAENICLLAGNAGMGKTVIMKDLYEKLVLAGEPVLALKADKQYAANLSQLQAMTNLSLPLFDMVEQCKQKFSRLVILIDQIDALSQSLSSDRSFLNTYTQLINNYKYDSAVRIIVSVRIFDLYYDPALRVYRNVRTVEVRKLSEEEVLSQLGKLGLHKESITESLLSLLQTPNHLDVFSRVHDKSRNFAGINTIQDLYRQLWHCKILTVDPKHPVNSDRVASLVYLISESMHNVQQISVTEDRFEDYVRELTYLKSEELVRADGRIIQFFHQSFYDFVFAKRFVENRHSIIKLILDQEQSILLRSSLKMIVNALREYDHHLYIKEIRTVLLSSKILFHIKHLLVSNLASLEKPTREEKELFLNAIVPRDNLRKTFYQHALGAEWTKLLLSQNLLMTLVTPEEDKKATPLKSILSRVIPPSRQKTKSPDRDLNLCFQLLRRNFRSCEEEILDFLDAVDNKYFVSRILDVVKPWTNPRAVSLIGRTLLFGKTNNWQSYHTLNDIADHNPGYVFETVRQHISFMEDELMGQEDYVVKELFKKLFQKLPVELASFAFRELKESIQQKALFDRYSDVLSDYAIIDTDIENNDHLKLREYIFKLLAETLRNQAAIRSEFFIRFLAEHKQTRYKNILRLIVFALRTNESLYPADIHDLLVHLSRSRFFSYHGRLNAEVRLVLKNAYYSFQRTQQSHIMNLIQTMVAPGEMGIRKDGNEVKRRYCSYGLTKYRYLSSLPAEELRKNKPLYKQWQELSRKYSQIPERYLSGGGTAAGIVGPPLKQTAYDKMNDDQWMRSFKKYNSHHRDRSFDERDYLKGGLTEHSRAFEQTVKKKPAAYIKLIGNIIDNRDIPATYAISGIQALADSHEYNHEVLGFIKSIISEPMDGSQLRDCIRIATSLIHDNVLDKTLVDFLIHQALHNPNPAAEIEIDKTEKKQGRVDSILFHSINCSRGMAARALVYISDPRYENDIFEALERVFRDDFNRVAAAPFHQLAFLTNLNRQRGFEFFLKIISDARRTPIFASGIWSMQYFIHYGFEKLIPCISQLIQSDSIVKDELDSLGNVLFGAWLHHYPEAETLFKRLLTEHPETQSHAVYNAVEHFYFDGKPAVASMQTLLFIIERSNKEAMQRLGISFHRLDHIRFEDFYPVIEKYVQSGGFRISDDFLEYLTLQSARHTKQCLEMFHLAIRRSQIPEENEGVFIRDEHNTTKFIIGAYSSQARNQTKTSKQQQLELLKLFDEILLDDRFQNNVENILEKVIA